MTPSYENVIDSIQKLPALEQKKVLDWLEEHKPIINDEEENLENEVDRMLLKRGILKEIPVGLSEEDDDFEPVEIEGEPLSETIIRERG